MIDASIPAPILAPNAAMARANVLRQSSGDGGSYALATEIHGIARDYYHPTYGLQKRLLVYNSSGADIPIHTACKFKAGSSYEILSSAGAEDNKDVFAGIVPDDIIDRTTGANNYAGIKNGSLGYLVVAGDCKAICDAAQTVGDLLQTSATAGAIRTNPLANDADLVSQIGISLETTAGAGTPRIRLSKP